METAVLDVGKFFKAQDKFAHDAKHAPGIGVQELARLRGLEQTLVLVSPLCFL
jgi:hypothetical protein